MDDYNTKLCLASTLARLLRSAAQVPDCNMSLVVEAANEIDTALGDVSRAIMWVDEANTHLSGMVQDLATEQESLQYRLDTALTDLERVTRQRDSAMAEIDNTRLTVEVTDQEVERFGHLCSNLPSPYRLKLMERDDLSHQYRNIIRLIKQGNKVVAIKHLREISDLCLKEAKDLVESF